MLKINPCKICGNKYHTAAFCPRKARKPIKIRTYIRRRGKRAIINSEVNSLWLEQNPPDELGRWECYLKISPLCHRYVTAETINIEHSYSKTRHPELRERQDLLQPACPQCNKLKGSKDVSDFVADFPHLKKFVVI